MYQRVTSCRHHARIMLIRNGTHAVSEDISHTFKLILKPSTYKECKMTINALPRLHDFRRLSSWQNCVQEYKTTEIIQHFYSRQPTILAHGHMPTNIWTAHAHSVPYPLLSLFRVKSSESHSHCLINFTKHSCQFYRIM